MTIYAAVYTSQISSAIIVAFGCLALLGSMVEMAVDVRYPPHRIPRAHPPAPDAMELTPYYEQGIQLRPVPRVFRRHGIPRDPRRPGGQ
jgi:hypothetical protein